MLSEIGILGVRIINNRLSLIAINFPVRLPAFHNTCKSTYLNRLSIEMDANTKVAPKEIMRWDSWKCCNWLNGNAVSPDPEATKSTLTNIQVKCNHLNLRDSKLICESCKADICTKCERGLSRAVSEAS